MEPNQDDAGLLIRPAALDDYVAFTRLFTELLVEDPVPAFEVWAASRVQTTWTASRGRDVVGYCYFQEYRLPGAFPFRVKELDALAPLLGALRRHVPADESVSLVVEDDERIVTALESAGASVTQEFVHMVGPL